MSDEAAAPGAAPAAEASAEIGEHSLKAFFFDNALESVECMASPSYADGATVAELLALRPGAERTLLEMSLLRAAHAAGDSAAGQRLLLAAHAARKSVAVQPAAAAAADDDAVPDETDDELLLQLPLQLLPDQQLGQWQQVSRQLGQWQREQQSLS